MTPEARAELAARVTEQINTIIEACAPLEWLHEQPSEHIEPDGESLTVGGPCNHDAVYVSYQRDGVETHVVGGRCLYCGRMLTRLETLYALKRMKQ